jgi:hypothetical protein
MNVVSLAKAREGRRSAVSGCWTPDEAAQLTRLYSLQRGQSGAIGFAHGVTDYDDPQFFLISGDQTQTCTACVSRLTKDGQPWYVLEDGRGHIVREGGCLQTLVGQIATRSLTGWRTLTTLLAYSAQAFLGEGLDPQGVVSAAECLLAVA